MPKKIFLNAIELIDKQISRIEELMLSIGILAMAINSIIGVISRFVLNHSIPFTEELNRAFIIIVTFAGISFAARYGRHIRMSAIYDTFPPWLKKKFMILISLTTAFFMFFLCYYSIEYIVDVQSTGRVMPALRIPVYWLYLWAPVGFLFTGIQYALTALKNLREKEVYLSTVVLDGYDEENLEI
jgi:C4-dicarboxylate transporter, DctQ subunit